MNITYKNYTLENALRAKDLWNSEVGFIYPLSDELFYQNIVNCKYLFQEASFFAFDDDKLIGFIFPKIWDKDSLIEAYNDTGWISLFFVSHNYRKQKIGTTMFDYVEEKLKEENIKKIYIGRDINNFFPALPCDFDNGTFSFLEKRGYLSQGITHDAIKTCDGTLFNINPNQEIRFARKEEKEAVLSFIKNNFPGRWHYEAVNYFDDGGYVIALENKEIVGFLRVNFTYNKDIPYNLTWSNRFPKLGGLGPLGVNKEKRKHGIGSSLLSWSINFLTREKASHIMIDWTSLLAYYQKYGFEVWKCYRYYQKTF